MRKNKMQHTMGHRVRRMRPLQADATRSPQARTQARTRRQVRALRVQAAQAAYVAAQAAPQVLHRAAGGAL